MKLYVLRKPTRVTARLNKFVDLTGRPVLAVAELVGLATTALSSVHAMLPSFPEVTSETHLLEAEMALAALLLKHLLMHRAKARR